MRLLTPDRKNRNGHPIIAADSSIAPTVLDDGWPLANDETRLFWDWQPYRYALSRPRGRKAWHAVHAVRAAGHPRVGMGRRSLAAPARVRRPAHAPARSGQDRPPVLARGEWQGRQVVPGRLGGGVAAPAHRHRRRPRLWLPVVDGHRRLGGEETGVERGLRQRGSAAVRRRRDAERYPCERRRAVAHLDGAETQEGRGAISVDGTAAGPAHDVDVLRLTEERSPEQKSLKVSGRRAVPREANPASEVHAVERDPVKGAARREDPLAGATHR